MSNPISKTAYYTLGVRAWDAALPKPVCGDQYAQRFMNAEAKQIWSEFSEYKRPNSSNASRHRIIDDFIQQELNASPSAKVLIIGCGFDSRAFRLKGGTWTEIDESPIIDYKESVLPEATSPNSLRRISIDFGKEKLSDKISSLASAENTHIIIEGVFMYLKAAQAQELLTTLKQLFPKHIIYCDLMSKSFFEKYSRPLHEKIVALGATFTDLQERPEDLFVKNGYDLVSSTSVPLYAATHSEMDVPAFIIRYILKTLREGYKIWRFQYG